MRTVAGQPTHLETFTRRIGHFHAAATLALTTALVVVRVCAPACHCARARVCVCVCVCSRFQVAHFHATKQEDVDNFVNLVGSDRIQGALGAYIDSLKKK